MTGSEKGKWTPGPWKIESLGAQAVSIIARPFNDHYKAEVGRVLTDRPGGFQEQNSEVAANALLISKAPELVEALRELVEWSRLQQLRGIKLDEAESLLSSLSGEAVQR